MLDDLKKRLIMYLNHLEDTELSDCIRSHISGEIDIASLFNYIRMLSDDLNGNSVIPQRMNMALTEYCSFMNIDTYKLTDCRMPE